MGKVVKFTGSKLLGAELRRLRGGRSLKQISELSKSPPLRERITPVAAPTLSQIENGISFPSLETIHSLAHLYKRPVQQLLDLVVQDRLVAKHPVDGEAEATLELFSQHGREGNWHAALAVACVAERAADGATALKWRANRAQVLYHLGLVDDAIALLQACLDHPALPEAQAFRLHQLLASFMTCIGLHRSAALHQQAAMSGAPEDISDSARRHLLRGSAYSVLRANQERKVVDEREVRRALQDLDRALTLAPDDEPEFGQLIHVQRAVALALLGNAEVATRDLDDLVESARAKDQQQVLLEALDALGLIRLRQRRRKQAVRLFEESARIAADLGVWEVAFDRSFDIHELLKESDPKRAAVFLRRCERFYPLLAGRTPNLIRFEAVERGA